MHLLKSEVRLIFFILVCIFFGVHGCLRCRGIVSSFLARVFSDVLKRISIKLLRGLLLKDQSIKDLVDFFCSRSIVRSQLGWLAFSVGLLSFVAIKYDKEKAIQVLKQLGFDGSPVYIWLSLRYLHEVSCLFDNDLVDWAHQFRKHVFPTEVYELTITIEGEEALSLSCLSSSNELNKVVWIACLERKALVDVSTLAKDGYSHVWIGTRTGISMLHSASPINHCSVIFSVVVSLFLIPILKASLRWNTFVCMCGLDFDVHKHLLWVLYLLLLVSSGEFVNWICFISKLIGLSLRKLADLSK